MEPLNKYVVVERAQIEKMLAALDAQDSLQKTATIVQTQVDGLRKQVEAAFPKLVEIQQMLKRIEETSGVFPSARTADRERQLERDRHNEQFARRGF